MVFSESIISPCFPEENWVVEIKDILENNGEAKEVVVSVFEVPEQLRAANPVAYAPQLLAFGPYHHFRPKLYQMQRFKVAAAVKAQKDWLVVDFQQLVAQIEGLEFLIRTCYQRHLNIHADTLAWILAIDGLSLLKVLHSALYYYKNLPGSFGKNPFAEFSERTPDLDMILRDMLMLENQIPMIVLKAIAEKRPGSDNLQILVDFCETLSPLQLTFKPSTSEVVKHKHLLDLFYQMIICPKEVINTSSKEEKEDELQFSTMEIPSNPDCSVFKKLLATLSKLQFRFAALPEKLMTLLLSSLELLGITPHDFFDRDRSWIPTASQLNNAGLKFSTCDGINHIKYDNQTLYLPVITLNSAPDPENILSSKLTSEVILRNLVAYESLSKDKSESLPFTRYTQLMNGIIDNDEDVNLLKKANVIKGDLYSVEIAGLFNGLSESIEPKDRDINIDEAITKVNRYYDNTLRVKTNNILKKYIYSSWRFLTFLASFLLLALLALETFCDFYTCRVMRFKAA
ncbi:PREDICTED: putative UPF0481 protein At3g02645 [Theobroma cacao]|uniref:UPF0481 protein At3g02645 n=1 Tax=Theobroma cacao TaxID=3641 RepID=A0AB32V2R0_THECC|nr:PREDICTED: putative UPF0481 protein At3g02645 [Theobroma cacao]